MPINFKITNLLKDPRTNWKYVFIIFALTLLAGGGIWWSATKQRVVFPQLPVLKRPEMVEEEAADWKTYKNDDYGFEFKYPPDLMRARIEGEGKDLELVEDSDTDLFWTREQFMTYIPLQPPFLSMRIESLGERLLVDYVESKTSSACEMWFGFGEETIWGLKRKEQKTNEAGLEYFDVVCINAELGSDLRNVYFGNEDLVVILTFDYLELEPLYQEKILSTFRFVTPE